MEKIRVLTSTVQGVYLITIHTQGGDTMAHTMKDRHRAKALEQKRGAA